MKGFFPSSTQTVTRAPNSLIAKCGACGLFKDCKSPKMEPTGSGRRKILIVSEAPSKEEDDKGQHFIGPAGQLLEKTLRRYGINMRKDCTLTNSIICHPPNGETPDQTKLDYCRPNLVKTINETNPEIIIPVGGPAVQAVLKSYYKDRDVGSISMWSGFRIPCQKINTWICPIFHPSYVLRSEKSTVPSLLFNRHIEEISKLKGRPWNPVPDYESQVDVILDPARAAKIIRKMIKKGGNVAFDYEANTLYPERRGAKIICCSVCWNGRKTIAYPWIGEAVEATRELLRSPLGKIASNMKFEERWSRHWSGKPVRNWIWDTMLSAHVIDNRPDITGLKFQAFALLGVEAYEDHVKPFLKAKKGKYINRIESEIDLRQLLIYCGLDSLLEYLVAEIQMGLIGMDFNWKEKL